MQDFRLQKNPAVVIQPAIITFRTQIHQLTKAKSVAAVEIGKNEYVDADGVTYKNIDSDLISDADDVSEEEKHTFKYLSSLYDGIAGLEEQKRAIDTKIAASPGSAVSHQKSLSTISSNNPSRSSLPTSSAKLTDGFVYGK